MLVIPDARDKWQEMPVGGPWAKEMVVAANLGKLLETAASVDIISSFPQSWVLCLHLFASVWSCFLLILGNVSRVIQVCWRKISRYNEVSLASAGNVTSCDIMWYLDCWQMCFGEVGNIIFSVCVSGGGSFQANQFIGGRQAISWSHKGVFLAFWPLFDVGCNCLVKLLWHFLRRVAHTMEWLGILRKTLLKSIAHLKIGARQSRGEKTWIRYDDMNDFSREDIVTHCDTPWLFVWNRFDELIPFDCFDIIRCPNASGDYLLLRWRCVLPYSRRQSWWRCLEPREVAFIC